ncbi:MAG: phosphoribosylglycinamide formyltransferase [Spartobacteria bacterium]|nr:phosphoribosylglycinamide formyltransferase [Spartobacteria bacterium]
MIKLAVIGSGSGTNYQSIHEAVEDGSLSASIECVIADHADAYILERARRNGHRAEYIDCAPFKTKVDGAAELRLIALLQEIQVDYVVLAGFMRIIKPGLLHAFPRRILNIHPSLLPSFPGLHAWQQAMAYGVKVTGCTVHFVDAGTDSGPIILQRTVPVYADDTPEVLHARIQEQEHIGYVEALRMIANNKVTILDRVVTFN